MVVPGFLKSKIQAPDILRVMWIWSIIGILAFGKIAYDAYRPIADGFDINHYLIGRDFVNVWMGGRLAHEGKVAHLAPVEAYMAEMRSVLGPKYPDHNFSYPPHILALIYIFGLLPYFPAFGLWIVAGAAALTAALRRAAGAVKGWHVPALAVLSPAFLVNIVSGQNGAFTAACFLGGFYLSEASPLTAGVLFGLLTVKPHLGLLIPIALLLRRNWKCIASATATTLGLVGLSILLWGTQPWVTYLTETLPFQTQFLDMAHGFYVKMMPGVFADARTVLKMEQAHAMMLQAAAALWAFFTVMLAVKRDGITPRTVAMLALGTLIVLAYDFNYDMVMACAGVAVYLATLAEMSVLMHLVFGLLWALPLAIYSLKGVGYVPFSSAIMLGTLLMLHLQGEKKPAAAIEHPLRRFWIWTLFGLSWYISPFIEYYLPAKGVLDVNGNIVGDDFVNVWFGGRLALARKMDVLYMPDAYFHAMGGAFSQPFFSHNFSYFPNILPLIVVFGLLPYFPALLLWTAGGIAALVAAVRRNGVVTLGVLQLLLVVLSPANIINMVGGQNGAYTAALFLGGMYLCEAAPVPAGVLFGLLTVKPHLGILVPFVLIARRNWKCFGVAAATALALAAFSLSVWGMEGWQDYFTYTLPFQTGLLKTNALTPAKLFMPGPYADLMTVMGVNMNAAIAWWGCIALASAAMAFRVLRREGLTPRCILMLEIATLIILPYGFGYDMVGIAGALVVYMASSRNLPRRNFVALGMLWALPALLINLKQMLPLPLSSLIMVSALACLYFESRGRAVRDEPAFVEPVPVQAAA